VSSGIRDYDSEFFAQHPNRQYRLRFLEPEEFMEFRVERPCIRIINGERRYPLIAIKRWRHPNGYELFTRIIVANPPGARGTTTAEEEARAAFEMTSPAARFAAAAFIARTPGPALH
jgi:hypothetical protein